MASAPRRVHICGGPGSGKTALARRLASALDIPAFDIDDVLIVRAWHLPAASELGVPLTRSESLRHIEASRDKLSVCRTKADIESLLGKIAPAEAAWRSVEVIVRGQGEELHEVVS